MSAACMQKVAKGSLVVTGAVDHEGGDVATGAVREGDDALHDVEEGN